MDSVSINPGSAIRLSASFIGARSDRGRRSQEDCIVMPTGHNSREESSLEVFGCVAIWDVSQRENERNYIRMDFVW